jgi:hypothetical protein
VNVAPEIKVEAQIESDELWFKDAIVYQLHVKAFADSNSDGVGDFAGLTSKLDYLEDLGVTTLWLLPFYPSPGRDDGYDISDYRHINPDFGTMQDFRRFMQEAKRRKLRVITELVINHTSDQHPWFQRARRGRPSSDARNWYVWSDTDHRFSETRIIFNDTEKSNWTWDPDAQAYYWHRFSILTIRGCFSPWSRSCGDGLISASTAFAWTRYRICVSAKAPTTRTSRKPTPSSRTSGPSLTHTRPERCFSPKPISGRKTSVPISVTATNATWHITFR